MLKDRYLGLERMPLQSRLFLIMYILSSASHEAYRKDVSPPARVVIAWHSSTHRLLKPQLDRLEALVLPLNGHDNPSHPSPLMFSHRPLLSCLIRLSTPAVVYRVSDIQGQILSLLIVNRLISWRGMGFQHLRGMATRGDAVRQMLPLSSRTAREVNFHPLFLHVLVVVLAFVLVLDD